MDEHQISPIDLVLVNLYPFENTVANPDCSLEDAVENIDIGGPTMVRAAAKNHRDVAIVVNSSDYDSVLEELAQNDGQLSYETRFDLAIKAYEHTAAYDGAIANYFGRLVPGGSDKFPRTFNSQFVKSDELRYGENSHQSSAFYTEKNAAVGSISSANQIQGKALSYNNIADTDAALETVKLFDEPACVIVKHANPCGVAVADGIGAAYELAFATDTESAFGGIIAFNRELDGATAANIVGKQFVEVIIAPSVSEEAKQAVAEKKNVRLLECGQWGQMSRVNSARIAAIKAEHAGLEVNGSCMASDAFFPFRDGIDNAGQVGISCVIQPGGSIRDEEVIAAADEHGMAMVFTGMRHFRH
eukprot:g16886.t1